MRRAKILIVEDELIARENLEHVLKKEGRLSPGRCRPWRH